MLIDSAIFAQQKSNQKSRAEHPVVSVVGVGEAKEFLPARPNRERLRARGKATRPYLHILSLAHPFSHKTQDSKKLENIRENASLRNLESKTEILGNTESKAIAESSPMDSRSHGYCLDSQNRLFAQKEKGFIPSPLAKAPKRIKRHCFCCAALATRWVFSAIGESLAFSLSSQKC